MFSGTHQRVQLDVHPPGTEVSVYRWNGELVAGPEVSPRTMKVHRPVAGRPYLVRASKDGYCPQYWLVSYTYTPGAALEVVLTYVASLVGLTGLIIDGATGGCCSMKPDDFTASLKGDAACAQ